MIRCIRSEYVSSGENDGRTVWMEAAGLSTDQKPSDNIVTGSKFFEVDTGKEYAYDEIGGEWYEMANGGSSGGSFNPDITSPQDGDTLVYNAAQSKWVNGAPSGGVLLVHEVDGTLDVTWQQIHDAEVAVLHVSQSIGIISLCMEEDGIYSVDFAMLLPNGTGFDDPLKYTATSATGTLTASE